MKSAFKIASLLTLFLLSVNLLSALAEGEQVIVTKVTGAPEIIRQGQTLPASVGLACQKEDVLKTTLGCSMDVAVNQLAGCRVLPATECLIADANPGAMDLKVTNGNIILNLKKLPQGSTFRVETPTAVAAVRGTQFWGRVDLQKMENPVTTFAVREGTVEIFAKSAGKNFTIEKGHALDIPKDSSTTPAIRTALPGELEAMEQAPSIKTTD